MPLEWMLVCRRTYVIFNSVLQNCWKLCNLLIIHLNLHSDHFLSCHRGNMLFMFTTPVCKSWSQILVHQPFYCLPKFSISLRIPLKITCGWLDLVFSLEVLAGAKEVIFLLSGSILSEALCDFAKSTWPLVEEKVKETEVLEPPLTSVVLFTFSGVFTASWEKVNWQKIKKIWSHVGNPEVHN